MRKLQLLPLMNFSPTRLAKRTGVREVTAPAQEIRCQGLGVSEGVVIGQVMRLHDGTPRVYRWRISDAGIDGERLRFRAAVDLARERVVDQGVCRKTTGQGPRIHFRCAPPDA